MKYSFIFLISPNLAQKMFHIFSVAKCLGALTVSTKTLELCKKLKTVHSVVVEDIEAVSACLRFAGK